MGKLIKKWCEISLIVRILIALVFGIVLGIFLPSSTWFSSFGTVFVGAMKAIAPLLVFTVVCTAVAQANGNIGKRFKTVLLLYALNTLCAAFIAVMGSLLFPVKIKLAAAVSESVGKNSPGSLAEVFLHLLSNVVQNPIVSMSSGNYLGILFWAVILGISIKKVAGQNTVHVFSDISKAVSLIVKGIIQLAPFGIFGLVYKAVNESGVEVFRDYGKLLLLLIGCMLVSVFIVNPIIVSIFLKRNSYPLVLKCLKESGIPAFFTRSSAANIPVNMNLCQSLGLDKDFYSVSIPLGSTINVSGATVTITVMALAVCHTLGIKVDFSTSLMLSLLSAISAPGAPGVTGGSLLLIPMACSLFGVGNEAAMQAVGVGFIIGIVQDSFETALNSSGDALFTVTAEYVERRKNGENIDFLCGFSRKSK